MSNIQIYCQNSEDENYPLTINKIKKQKKNKILRKKNLKKFRLVVILDMIYSLPIHEIRNFSTERINSWNPGIPSFFDVFSFSFQISQLLAFFLPKILSYWLLFFPKILSYWLFLPTNQEIERTFSNNHWMSIYFKSSAEI